MSAENGRASSDNPEKRPPVLLLDVAGTTTSNAFVKETLFPYVLSNIQDYLKTKWEEDEVKALVKQLAENEEDLTVEKAVDKYKALSEKDENHKSVKELQGLIYKKGYEDGSLKAHIFPDVPEALENWSKTKSIAIYSSGSIESQKLLFAHTTEGDITKYISHYFDLSIGSKNEDSSYAKIAEKLSINPEDLIYINDNIDEANAAKKSGATAILIKRDGNKEIPESESVGFTIINSLSELPLESSGKRKNEEEDTPEAPPTKLPKTETESTAVENTTADDSKETTKVEDAVEAMEVDQIEAEHEEEEKKETPTETIVEPATAKVEDKITSDPLVGDQDVEMAEEAKNTKPVEVNNKDEEEKKIDEPIQKDSKITEDKTESVTVNKEVTKDDVDKMETEEKVIDSAVEKEEIPTEEKNEVKVNTDESKDVKEDAVVSKENDKIEEKPAEKVETKEETVCIKPAIKENTEMSKAEPINVDVQKEITNKASNSTESEVEKSEVVSETKSKIEEVKDATKEIKNEEMEVVKESSKEVEPEKETITKKDKTSEAPQTCVKPDPQTEENDKMETDIKPDEAASGSKAAEKTEKDVNMETETKPVKDKSDTSDVNMEEETKPVEKVNVESKETIEVPPVKEESTTSTVDVSTADVNKKEEEEESKKTTDGCVNNATVTEAEKSAETVEETKECPAKIKESSEPVAKDSPTETKENVEVTNDIKEENRIEKVENADNKEVEKIESEETTENVNGEATTSEEKENQSDLANGTSSGVENGSDDVKNNGEVEKNTTEEEIKVKKLEEKPDSTPVSVEA